MSHLNLTFKGTQSIRILAKPNSHFGHYFKIISVMQKHCLGVFVWVDTRNIEINTETSKVRHYCSTCMAQFLVLKCSQIFVRHKKWDHFTFLGNCPPTPSLSQHFALRKNWVLMLVNAKWSKKWPSSGGFVCPWSELCKTRHFAWWGSYVIYYSIWAWLRWYCSCSSSLLSLFLFEA